MEFVQRWSIANGGHIQGIYLSWEINHSRETMSNSCLPSFTQNIHQQNIILKSAPSPPIVVNIKSLLVSHPFKGSHNAESSKVHHVAKQWQQHPSQPAPLADTCGSTLAHRWGKKDRQDIPSTQRSLFVNYLLFPRVDNHQVSAHFWAIL